jgi:ketosteroid isomerase-like protein
MMGSISPDQVRAEIQKFWQIMCGKPSPAGALEALYSPAAVVLSGKARTPEPATLALARRKRQIGRPDGESVVEVGAVEVQIEEPGVAIASYTYRFHQNRSANGGGQRTRHTLFGRATQIFQRDQRGVLRIVHEHLSAATNPQPEKD